MLVVVLNRLEAHDEVDACVRQGDIGATAHHVLKILSLIAISSVLDRIKRNANADYPGGPLRQHRRPIAFTAGDVQNHLPGGDFAGLQVAVQVLKLYRSVHLRHEPFAGEFHGWRLLLHFCCRPTFIKSSTYESRRACK